MKKCLSCNENFVSTGWICPHCHWKPVFNGRFPLFAPEHAEDSSGFEDNFFPYLFALESSNFWFVARNKLILYFIHKYFPGFRNFLEIGCGTGFVLSSIAANFPKAAIAGSELSVHGLSYAFNRVNRGSFIQMDATNIPFHEEFDLIGSFDVLEHIADDVSALAGIYCALAPGGVLIVTVPQHAWLWSDSDDMAHHVRRYSRQEISAKLKQAGYEILRTSSFVSFLLPFMMISRLKKGRDREEIMSDLNLNPIINMLFKGVMASERKLIEHGVNFPVGGSLIIVARKNP
jgi:SAM-dependent methyltransferase